MNARFINYLQIVLTSVLLLAVEARSETTATITVQADAPGIKISPDLFGIFFEDLSYAADGGLYAELVQNRSFDYSSRDNKDWNSLTAWQMSQHDGGTGSVAVETNSPLNAQNLSYAVLTIEKAGSGVGLINEGFDGIAVKAGETYRFSLFARQLSGIAAPVIVRLESKTGALLAEANLPAPTKEWREISASLKPTTTDADARLVVLATSPGKLALDMVSLFPAKTFHNRSNGLRADLAQVIADLHPKFMRFPGGCLVHGDGLDNIYHWKDTLGPVEQRKGQSNIWRYHQSVGLGYFEYFQFCEDIGAKPLPVVAAGVCCQNSDYLATGTYGIGQKGLPMDEMPAYIQDVLDLIEWANGPVTSIWGAKRAAAGHPAPFHLQYLGIGNEDKQTDVFRERFKMIYDAVKTKHPEITIVGTVGPDPDGDDFEKGWKFANKLNVDMVDEHYYRNPDWFLANLHRYDNYNRAGTKVYVGEYASWGNTLFNAMAEAAYLTSLERNGDVVRMASYAPLLCKEQHVNWRPDLIYFNNTTVCPSVNYYVQQLFSQNQGDVYLPTKISASSPSVQKIGFLLGTWDTQAQFKDIKVTSGDKTVLEESFQSGDQHWVPEGGNWSVADGVYIEESNRQPATSFLQTKINQSDYTLTLKAKKTGGQEGFLIGFGSRDDRNYYWWNLGGWGNTQHGIEKTSNGSKTTIGATEVGNIELNRWYEIKIIVSDSSIKCFLDGALIHNIVDAGATGLAASCVKDTATGDVILKLVNVTGDATQGQINLHGIGQISPVATRTILAGEARAQNTFQKTTTVLPASDEIKMRPSFVAELPAQSLTVIRIKTQSADQNSSTLK